MRASVAGVFVFLVVAGCKSKPRPRGDATATGAGTAATGSAAPSTAACDLNGDYRLRFEADAIEWWFRVRVTAAGAELTEPVPALGLPRGAVTVSPDPSRCRLTVHAASKRAGAIQVVADVDAKGEVFGRLVRETAASEDDRDVAIGGVRDVAPPEAPTCLVPGVYRLQLATPAWQPLDEGEGRTCARFALPPIHFRIEPFGDTIAVTEVVTAPPAEAGADTEAQVDVTRTRDCAIEIDARRDDLVVEASLALAPDRITGTARITATGGEAKDPWPCVTEGPITLIR